MAKADTASTTVAAEVIEGLKQVPPATIGHFRSNGFVDTAIRPVYPIKGVLAGRAVTVKMARGDTALTRPAIDALSPGDVLVIDQGGEEQVASWGEMTSLAAQKRGAAAVIIEGAVTDVVEIEEMGMPTYARRISPVVGRRLNLEGGINVTVSCGGAVVNPGDVIVADQNGIVVLPAGEAEAVWKAGKALEDKAPYQRIWLRNGGPLAEMAGLDMAQLEAKIKEKGWR